MANLRYPKERLTDESDYLKIFISEYVPRTAESTKKGDLITGPTGSERNSLKNPLHQIILPIPKVINVSMFLNMKCFYWE